MQALLKAHILVVALLCQIIGSASFSSPVTSSSSGSSGFNIQTTGSGEIVQ